MEHTKGELKAEYSEQSGAWIAVDEKDRIMAYHCSEANAQRLVKCWNCNDNLVAALQLTRGFCVNFRQTEDWENHPDIGVLYAIVLSALEKAK